MSNDELQKAIDDITSGEAAMDAGSSAAGASVATSSDSSASGTDGLDNILGTPPAPDTSSEMPTGLGDLANPAAGAAPSVDEGPLGKDPLEGFDPSTVTLNTTKPEEKTDTSEGTGAAAAEPELSVPAMDMSVPSMPEAPVVESTVSEAPTEIASVPEVPAEISAIMPAVGAAAVEVAPADTNDVEIAALKELYPLLPKMNINPRQKFDICMKVIEKTGDKGAGPAALEAAKAITDEAEKGECLMKLIETFKS